MTHVFIVDNNTFKYHLEYMFAGTGGKSDACFLTKKDSNVTLHWKTEATIVDMISDISRIKNGDKILFYVQADGNQGKFYGVFKAKGSPFYDSNDDNYLYKKLNKTLNFRIEIEPDIVYEKGVTEHAALDELDGIEHPSQMCWSLIYRKLRANRGCTMISDYESDKLIEKIRKENANTHLNSQAFSYVADLHKIIGIEQCSTYDGKRLSLDIKDRLLYKSKKGNSFEAHLQAYILQNHTKKPLSDLLLDSNENRIWIGNEVACGVGMQRIDIMLVQNSDKIIIKPIELKCIEPEQYIIDSQLAWYIKWINDYIVPTYMDKTVEIEPTIIARKFASKKNQEIYVNMCTNKNYKFCKKAYVKPISLILFDIKKDNIIFKKVL